LLRQPNKNWRRSSNRLFAGPGFHRLLEHYKAKLAEAYEQFQAKSKEESLLGLPVLRSPGEVRAVESIVKIEVRRLANRLPGLGNQRIFEDIPEFAVDLTENPRTAA
jgi:Ser/Thr protein kinase RdoA (MazF antagonist)